MQGLTENEQGLVYFRLLELVNELQSPMDQIVDCLQASGNIDPHPEIAMIKGYLEKSSGICKELEGWCETQLFGELRYSKKISWHVALLVKVVTFYTQKELLIYQSVEDLSGGKVNLRVFSFVLYKLLRLITDCSVSEELNIGTIEIENKLRVSIDGIQFSTYAVMANTIELNSINDFRLCYEAAAFYGGNLWSVIDAGGKGKLYFELPIVEKS